MSGSRIFPYTTLFRSMGGGDIKMMAMVGSFVGWKGVLLTVFLGALLGSLIFVPLSLRKIRLPSSAPRNTRSEEHTSELQSRVDVVCRLVLEQEKNIDY